MFRTRTHRNHRNFTHVQDLPCGGLPRPRAATAASPDDGGCPRPEIAPRITHVTACFAP
jgi:hypothetical protein